LKLLLENWREYLNEDESSVPIIHIPDVFHTGEMDISKKSQHSHEATALSVTTEEYIEDWQKIARIAGKVQHLHKDDGKFIDFHKISDMSQIYNWGIEEGYLEPSDIYEVSYYDDEMEDEMTMSFRSREEAELEAHDYGEEIKVKKSFVPTEKMQSAIGTKINQVMVDDYITLLYSENISVDGVWWEDILDARKFSAPRGGITPSKISSWDAKIIR